MLFCAIFNVIIGSDIRLVGGSSDWEGRVEVFLHGQWGTVRHDAWTSIDAQVACRQLGYSVTSKPKVILTIQPTL